MSFLILLQYIVLLDCFLTRSYILKIWHVLKIEGSNFSWQVWQTFRMRENKEHVSTKGKEVWCANSFTDTKQVRYRP